MAELSRSPEHERRFIVRFPPAYNAVHGTLFTGEPECAGKVEGGWDYRWPDPDRPGRYLEVQHTVGASDAAFERVHTRNAVEISSAIAQRLKRTGSLGHLVSLSADATPRRRPAREVAIDCLGTEIERAIRAGISAQSAASGRIPWRTTTKPIERGTFAVEVRNMETTTPSMVLCIPTPNSFLENPMWRLAEAVRRKSERIGRVKTDTTLLVDFDLNGFDLEDVPALTAELEDEVVPFREVWVADLRSNTRIVRVWPSLS